MLLYNILNVYDTIRRFKRKSLSLRNRIKRKSLSYNNLGIFITPTSTLDPLFDPVLTHFFSPKNRL